MAFETSVKIKILKFLGWPANTINSNSLSYSNIITSRFLVVLPEAEEEVLSLVDRITEVDASLASAVDSAGVKKIDDIEFFGAQDGTKLSALRAERNRLIKELASLLDMEFGPGYSGGLPGMGGVCL